MIAPPVSLIYTSISKSSEPAAPHLCPCPGQHPARVQSTPTPWNSCFIFMGQVSERVNLHRAPKPPWRVSQDTGRAQPTIKNTLSTKKSKNSVLEDHNAFCRSDANGAHPLLCKQFKPLAPVIKI